MVSKAKARVKLICWDEDYAAQRAGWLKTAGFTVDAEPLLGGGGIIGKIRASAPDAVAIDLDRLPSHGRECGILMRSSPALRYIPIVFAGGAKEKVERIRAELPDATYARWRHIGPALRRAMKTAPAAPVRPVPHMQRWSGSGLMRKLGVTARMQVALLGECEGFDEKLGELPEGAVLVPRVAEETRLAIYFVRTLADLEAAFEQMTGQLPATASVWIIHPKQSGRYRADFNQNDVREMGLACGLVDYKVCAVDSDWSGLKFAHRKKASPRH